MIVITLHDIVEILVWVCIILFFIWLGSSEKKDKKSEDKRNDIK
jgi:hypothetical protein